MLLPSHDRKQWREEVWVVADLDDDRIAKTEDVSEGLTMPNNR
jgi:hypothetical protein